MTTKNVFIFKGLQIIAWIIFVGLSIEAGALLVNFVFSLYRPEFLPNLYQKLDLTGVYQDSKAIYGGVYAFILSISLLKVYLFYAVILLMRSFNMDSPFQFNTSQQLFHICYTLFSLGILSLVARKITENVLRNGLISEKLNVFWVDTDAFILTAAVVYVVACIYTRGVEIQHENDLTV